MLDMLAVGLGEFLAIEGGLCTQEVFLDPEGGLFPADEDYDKDGMGIAGWDI